MNQATNRTTLRLAEQQIDDPAAADMLARLTAMVQEVGVGAAGVFQGVSEDWKAVESTVLVDGFGKLRHRVGKPGWIQRDGTKEKWAEDAAE